MHLAAAAAEAAGAAVHRVGGEVTQTPPQFCWASPAADLAVGGHVGRVGDVGRVAREVVDPVGRGVEPAAHHDHGVAAPERHPAPRAPRKRTVS